MTTLTATTLQTLVAARAKVEQGWTQRAFARDRLGLAVKFGSDKAVCWCLEGALLAVGSEAMSEAGGLLQAVISSLTSLFCWNDTPGRTKEEVLGLFDKVIGAAS